MNTSYTIINNHRKRHESEKWKAKSVQSLEEEMFDECFVLVKG